MAEPRRAYTRFPTDQPASLVLDTREVPVRVVNQSIGGLCVLANNDLPLHRGRVCRLQTDELAVEVRVVDFRRANGRTRVGLQRLREFPVTNGRPRTRNAEPQRHNLLLTPLALVLLLGLGCVLAIKAWGMLFSNVEPGALDNLTGADTAVREAAFGSSAAGDRRPPPTIFTIPAADVDDAQPRRSPVSSRGNGDRTPSPSSTPEDHAASSAADLDRAALPPALSQSATTAPGRESATEPATIAQTTTALGGPAGSAVRRSTALSRSRPSELITPRDPRR